MMRGRSTVARKRRKPGVHMAGDDLGGRALTVLRLPNEMRQRVEALRVALSERAGGVDPVTSHIVRGSSSVALQRGGP